jgi:Flp pilus assembly protein TadG
MYSNFRSQKKRRGASAVEMAMVLPIFLLVIFGMVEFGRAFMAEHLIANGARMGARRSVVEGSTNAECEQIVKDFCADSLGISSDKVTVSIEDDEKTAVDLASATTGDMCTISVSVAFDQISFLPGSFLGGAQISGSCTMERE